MLVKGIGIKECEQIEHLMWQPGAGVQPTWCIEEKKKCTLVPKCWWESYGATDQSVVSQSNFAAVNFWPADGVLAQLICFMS